MTTTQPATRAVRQPLPTPAVRRPADPRIARRVRRRRIVTRFVPAVGIVVVLAWGVDKLFEPRAPADPAEVAAAIQDQVARELVARTNDYSLRVGPLDCVALQPDKGNCLADVQYRGHRKDGVMIAVSYTDLGDQYELVIKMP